MFCTVDRRSRAIVGAVFFVGALTGVGCGPDLDRLDGGLEVTVSQIAADADELRIELFAFGGASTYAATLVPEGSSLVHVVESVPEGAIDITARATRSGAVIQSALAGVDVNADAVTAVELALSAGDVSSSQVDSPPIETIVGPLSEANIVEERLEGRALLPGADLVAFVDLANRRLTGGLGTIELIGASVELRPGAEEVEKLQDLWRGPLSLAISDGTATIEVASAGLGEDRTGIDLVPISGVDLRAMIGTGETAVYAELRGPAKVDVGESRSASVRVTVTFRGRS